MTVNRQGLDLLVRLKLKTVTANAYVHKEQLCTAQIPKSSRRVQQQPSPLPPPKNEQKHRMHPKHERNASLPYRTTVPCGTTPSRRAVLSLAPGHA